MYDTWHDKPTYSHLTDNHVQENTLTQLQNLVAVRTEVLPGQRQGKKTNMSKVWNNCILTRTAPAWLSM